MERAGFVFHQKSSVLCQVNEAIRFLGPGGELQLIPACWTKYRGWGLLKWLPFTPKPNSAALEEQGSPCGEQGRGLLAVSKSSWINHPSKDGVWWCLHINSIHLFHRAWQTLENSGMSESLTNNIFLIANTAGVHKSCINDGQMSYTWSSCLAQCGFSAAPCWAFCLFVCF